MSKKIETGLVRPQAEGFPAAPVIEAVLSVGFGASLSDHQMSMLATALEVRYPTRSAIHEQDIEVDPSTGLVEVKPVRQGFRMEGVDPSDVCLLKSDSLTVSRLAPYQSWERLFDRFDQDFRLVMATAASAPLVRIATRFINRIDIALAHGPLVLEEYFTTHIRVPSSISTVEQFYFRYNVPIDAISSTALIQSAIMPPISDDMVSIALDIDISRSVGIPNNVDEILQMLNLFRETKNSFYKSLLTEKARSEFK
jgi:uncharacterized protein (TIGR04255 family)